ncbi:hypothetical protein [Amycolatopsis sp. NPDC058986]|uniref:hypothetical protein n=1 Tax=unclassified Amycolatopsis TaxID=2618356 RepID=UPI00366CEE3F
MSATRRPRVPAPDRGEPGLGASPAVWACRERVLLAPAVPVRTGRGSRRRWVWLLALGLIVVLGGLLAIQAWAAPSPPGAQRAALAQPAPPQPPPLPLPTVAPPTTCAPDSPDPTCHFPTGTPRPSVPATPLPPITELPPPATCVPGQIGCTPGGPAAAPSAPCTGENCIPQPSTTPPTTMPGQNGPGVDGDDPDCGITNISGCINKAITVVFRDLAKSALDPVLKLLGNTAFTTPPLDELPGVANLWHNSWLIVMACYGGLIMIGGIIVMAHESVQSRYSIKEIAPRLVVSFFASMLSLFLIDKAIKLANALSAAVLGGGVDPPKLGATLAQSINGIYSAMTSGGLFVILLQVLLLVAVIALLAAGVGGLQPAVGGGPRELVSAGFDAEVGGHGVELGELDVRRVGDVAGGWIGARRGRGGDQAGQPCGDVGVTTVGEYRPDGRDGLP